MTGLQAIEEAIVAQFLGEITEAEAIDRIRSAVNVTEHGARDLLWAESSPSARYTSQPEQSGGIQL